MWTVGLEALTLKYFKKNNLNFNIVFRLDLFYLNTWEYRPLRGSQDKYWLWSSCGGCLASPPTPPGCPQGPRGRWWHRQLSCQPGPRAEKYRAALNCTTLNKGIILNLSISCSFDGLWMHLICNKVIMMKWNYILKDRISKMMQLCESTFIERVVNMKNVGN